MGMYLYLPSVSLSLSPSLSFLHTRIYNYMDTPLEWYTLQYSINYVRILSSKLTSVLLLDISVTNALILSALV